MPAQPRPHRPALEVSPSLVPPHHLRAIPSGGRSRFLHRGHLVAVPEPSLLPARPRCPQDASSVRTPCPCRCPCHKDQLPWGHPESPPRCLHDIRTPCPPQTRDHLLLGSGETPASPEPPAAHGPRQPWAEPAPSCRRTQGDTALPSPGSCCVSVSPLLGKGGLLGVQVISALLGWGPSPCSSCLPLGAFSPSGLRGSWAPRPPPGFLCCFFLFPHFSGWTQ